MNRLLHALLTLGLTVGLTAPMAGAGHTSLEFPAPPPAPASVRIYLYAHGSPVNGTDPSGHAFDISSTMSAMGNSFAISTRVAVGAWQAYDKAQWLKDGVQIAYKTIGTGTVDPVTMGLWLSDFIPLRKVAGLAQKVGTFTGLGKHLSDVAGGIKGMANAGKEQIGHLAANAVARAKSLQITSFRPRGNGGFDDVFKDKDGFFVIVESKAGLNPRLNPAAGMNPAQMSQEWIRKNIDDLERYDEGLAQEMRQALRQGRIKGMVVNTKIDADGKVFDPEWDFKDWSEIGQRSWNP